MVDPKVKNLFKFLGLRLLILGGFFYVLIKYVESKDPIRIVGIMTLLLAGWRISLSVYRRLIQPPKDIHSYGKWAIITGCTSGIGKEYANYLAKKKMNLILISRDETKLIEQKNELLQYNVLIEYLVYDFTDLGAAKTEFYLKLDKLCEKLNKVDKIGLLINNVGIANEIPRFLDELTDIEVSNMINCNVFSTVNMTRSVMKYMKINNNGAIINVSSGSGNHPGPFLAVYSATKYVSFIR